MTAALASALFSAAWKGTLLIGFALVVHRVARNRIQPRWLCLLLLLALVRLLVPFAPPSSFSIFNLVPREQAAAPKMIVIDDAPPQPAAPPRQFAVRSVAPPSPSWLPLLLGIWAAGALVSITRVAVRAGAFRRLLRDRQPADLGPLLEECRRALHVRRRVRVVVTGAVSTPSLHGWLRPMLLLPHGFLETFTREQLRYVVLHELAHLRRADVLVSWIATAASSLHWFNPLVRHAVARLAEERELACDAIALEALRAEERSAYGGTVLQIVERGAPMIPALVGMTATPQQLKRRILMIASFRRQSRTSILFGAFVTVLALATFTDARAGEQHMKVRQFDKVALSPAAKENVKRLDQVVNLDLRSASAQDVLNAISNATGVNIAVADGALDPAAPRMNIRSTDVSAHLLLMETLSSLDLGVKFSDAGIEVVKSSDTFHHHGGTGTDERVVIMRHPGDAAHAGHPAGTEKRVMVMRHGGDEHHAGLAAGDDVVRKTVDVKAEANGNKRTLTVRTGDDKPVGTLEIEVLK